MRFRSVGISASNMDEYLSKLKAQEAEYMEEIHDGDVIEVFWENK